jgi:alginate O-acetyltransferase complex protein AlgI
VMLFNSYEYLFGFLPLMVAGYWLAERFASRSVALGWLLLGSIGFYACASLKSLGVLLPSILLDYALASAFLRSKASARVRNTFIYCGIVANVALLGYFKYRNFFLEEVGWLLRLHASAAPLALPLGISFLTFQKIAFLSDVRSGKVKEITLRDFLQFALFFPRTIAGPIVHYNEVMPQLLQSRPRRFAEDAMVAICLLSIGLFKKCVISDGVTQFVPYAFDPEPAFIGTQPTLVYAWTGVLAYVLELYFDFSGYSDMALGAARLFGVRLPMNFNSPLKATSVVDYWSRWHITLTRFLTWNVYVPLVSRLTHARVASHKEILRGAHSAPGAIAMLLGVPTAITMLISGMWHGTGWHFVVWGLLHGVYLIVNQTWRLLRPRFWTDQTSYERIMRPVGFVLTFTCVAVALVFFRAQSVAQALSILSAMGGLNGIAPYPYQILHRVGLSFDWTIIWPPLIGLKWILPLLAAAWLLPNSLELLSRFGPALDFPPATNKPQPIRSEGVQAPITQESEGSGWSPRRLYLAVKQLGHAQAPLNRLTAAIVGLLFLLGAVAVGHSGGFLYGQF